MRQSNKFKRVVLLLGVLIALGMTLSSSAWADIYTATSGLASLPATLSLSTIDGVKIPFQNGIPVTSFERQDDRTVFNMGGTWKYQRQSMNHTYSLTNRSTSLSDIQTESGGRYQSNYDDSGWSTKTLPAVENTMCSYEDTDGPEVYENGVWYRRTFTADNAWNGEYVKLVFYSVNYIADVWINGDHVGYHEGGYTPFAFDVSSRLNYGESNTIAIRVDNIPWDTRTDIMPAIRSDWMNYTGVIQDMYLEISDPVNVVRANVKPTSTSGNIEVKVAVYNAGDTSQNVSVNLTVYHASVTEETITSITAEGIQSTQATVTGTTSQSTTVAAGATKVLSYSLGITSPNLWTPDDPDLYVLKASLDKGGNFVEDFFTQFGVRVLGIGSGAKMLLNGHATFFTGCARHEEWSDTGRTATMSKIKTDLDKINDMKVNFIRTAHYPNHPYTYLLTDRMGFTVMEEIPFWWSCTYEFADQASRQIADQTWREMIFRDYNRPSIIMWSTCNETGRTSLKRRKAYIERLHRDVDLNYNDGRFTVQSASADRPGADDETQNACDIAGWTMYFGVFHGGTYYQGTLDFLDAAHTNFPNKPILNTEFGYYSAPNDSEQTEQNTCFQSTFDAFEARKSVDSEGNIVGSGFVPATQWWTAYNWYTQREQLPGPIYLQTMASIHMNRTSTKTVYNSMISDHGPYYNIGGLSTGTLPSSMPDPPSQSAPPEPGSVPAGDLQDFEYPDSNFDVYQAKSSRVTSPVYEGTYSCKMDAASGEYHSVGAYIYERPVDISGYDNIRVYVYSTRGGRDTVEIRLRDSSGGTCAIWSTDKTARNQWRPITIALSEFSGVDKTKIIKVEFCVYWGDTIYYFDDLTVFDN